MKVKYPTHSHPKNVWLNKGPANKKSNNFLPKPSCETPNSLSSLSTPRYMDSVLLVHLLLVLCLSLSLSSALRNSRVRKRRSRSNKEFRSQTTNQQQTQLPILTHTQTQHAFFLVSDHVIRILRSDQPNSPDPIHFRVINDSEVLALQPQWPQLSDVPQPRGQALRRSLDRWLHQEER